MNIKEVKLTKEGKPFVIRAVNDYNDLLIRMKWDGCIDIRKYDNGDNPDSYSSENVSYMHICEVKKFIKELQDVVRIAEEMFGDDFKEYWEEIGEYNERRIKKLSILW